LGARLAEGEFFNIDQDRAVVHVKCPQDDVIIRLNTELNRTYLWFGAEDVRENYGANQIAQDENAIRYGAGASRGYAKANAAYNNFNRDLVDTIKEDRETLKKVKPEELPAPLQGKTLADQETYVKEMSARRASLQQEINRLAAQREAYLAKERARLAEEQGGETLGDAVVAAVNRQLAAAGFEQSTPAP
jgi:uncharacterized small protein (DUF1192 family)